MREAIRAALIALAVSTFGVFVIVPLTAKAFGMALLIYGAAPPPLYLIAELTLIALSPVLVIRAFFKRNDRRAITIRPRGSLLMEIFIILWIAIFLTSGGLTYRHQDVLTGVASRGLLLRVALTLINTTTIVAAALLLERRSWRHYALVAAYLLSLIASGGRGLSVQVLLCIYFARWIVTARGGSEVPSQYTTEGSEPRPSARRGRLVRERIFTLRNLIALGVGVIVLGIWGELRDAQHRLVFSTLLRAADPYWYLSWRHEVVNGGNFRLLWDDLYRISTLPLRWLGYHYSFGVDGASLILERYLHIPHRQGVSLPITYIGEGLLFHGVLGAIAYQGMVIIAVICNFWLMRRAGGLKASLKVAWVSFEIAKCFFLYPKSLSGVFLVLYYEPWRDYLLIMILSQLCLAASRGQINEQFDTRFVVHKRRHS